MIKITNTAHTLIFYAFVWVVALLLMPHTYRIFQYIFVKKSLCCFLFDCLYKSIDHILYKRTCFGIRGSINPTQTDSVYRIERRLEMGWPENLAKHIRKDSFPLVVWFWNISTNYISESCNIIITLSPGINKTKYHLFSHSRLKFKKTTTISTDGLFPKQCVISTFWLVVAKRQ